VLRAADASVAALAAAASDDAKLVILREAAARIVGSDVASPGDERLQALAARPTAPSCTTRAP
jgi:hypothetical protein